MYYVCLLLRSLYGLRQSANLWNKKFDDFLFQFDLMVSPADPCVHHNKDDLHTITGIYVDDVVIVSAQQSHTDDIITYLQTAFKVVLGTMDYFVNFQLEFDCDSHSIFIHQPRYISDIIHIFGLDTTNEATTPADPHGQL